MEAWRNKRVYGHCHVNERVSGCERGEPLVICTLINACYGESIICIVIMGEMAELVVWGRVKEKACLQFKNLSNVHILLLALICKKHSCCLLSIA